MGTEEWLDSAAYVQCVCYIPFFLNCYFPCPGAYGICIGAKTGYTLGLSSQHITERYFKIWRFGTLLKGPFAVL